MQDSIGNWVVSNLFKSLIFIFCALPFVASADARDGVQVDAVLNGGQPTLKFTIKNLSSENIEVETGLLPWGYGDAVWLKLETFNSSCGKLKEYVTLEDPPLVRKFVQIPPLVSTWGNVNLLNHWKDLKTRSHSCQDVLFWSYELVDRNNVSIGRYSGAIDLSSIEVP